MSARPARSRTRRRPVAGTGALAAALCAVLLWPAAASLAEDPRPIAVKTTPPEPAPALAARVGADEPRERDEAPPSVVRRGPVYHAPPDRGAPERRTGGATRRAAPHPDLVALAPDHLGRTRLPAPTLFWLASRDSDVPLEFSLVAKRPGQAPHPVLTVTAASHVERGIGSLSLADHGVELEPGVVYRWYVAAVMDPARRSRDVVAGGALERVSDMPATLVPGVESAGIYARKGFWYDAFGAVQLGILDPPVSPDPPDRLESARHALLAQVGISPSER